MRDLERLEGHFGPGTAKNNIIKREMTGLAPSFHSNYLSSHFALAVMQSLQTVLVMDIGTLRFVGNQLCYVLAYMPHI
jgi:hypothetical protein